jgi:predicted PurR-regulated permease PerM
MAKAPSKSTETVANATVVPRYVQFTMLFALIAGFLFVSPYIGTIMFAALIAFIFNPVYKATLRRTHRVSLAITATLFVAFLSVLIPVAIVVGITVHEANSIIDDLQQNTSVSSDQINDMVDRGTDRVNSILTALPGGEKLEINKQDVADNVKKVATEAVQALLNFIKNAGTAFISFITIFILGIFMIVGMLRYQVELIDFVRKISPFHESVTNDYLAKAGAMTKAMVKGQLIIAVCQGLAASFSLWIVGIDYYWFFFVILTFLSFIPLGNGVLTIPIAAVLVLTGNYWQGIFVFLFYLIVTSNIDNFLRPRLVPKTARLNSALTLLAVFSGLVIFGPAGVIYGPVVMILLITTFQMYAAYNAQVPRPAPPTE